MLMTAGRANFLKDQFINDMKTFQAALDISLYPMPVNENLTAYADKQVTIFENILRVFEILQSENPFGLESMGILYHLVLNESLYEFRKDSHSATTVAYETVLELLQGSVPASALDTHQMQACDIRLRSILIG